MGGGGGTQWRGRNDCVFSASVVREWERASERGRVAVRRMGYGVRLGKHSPLFASHSLFFSQGQTGNQASCSWAFVGEVDLSGFYISSRESLPTNLPPGARGHWPPSLLPRESQAALRLPATSLALTVMRTPRRGGEEDSDYVSVLAVFRPRLSSLHLHTFSSPWELSPSCCSKSLSWAHDFQIISSKPLRMRKDVMRQPACHKVKLAARVPPHHRTYIIHLTGISLWDVCTAHAGLKGHCLCCVFRREEYIFHHRSAAPRLRKSGSSLYIQFKERGDGEVPWCQRK